MRLVYRLWPLLFAAPALLLAAGADTVNERLPVRKAELEAHWRVDCATSWRELEAAVDTTPGGYTCQLPDGLSHRIKLCAYIYQPPGSPATHRCPDYQGALSRLEPPGPEDPCPRLATFLQQQSDCLPRLPDP